MRIFPKLLLSLIPPAAVATGAVVFYSDRIVHAVMISEMERIAVQRSSDLSAVLSLGLIRGSETLLLPSLQECRRTTGALSAGVLGGDGRVIANTNVGEVGRRYDDPFIVASLSSPKPRARELPINNDGPVLDLTIPIFAASKGSAGEDFLLSGSASAGRRLGTLRLTLPLEQAGITEKRIVRGVLGALVGSSAATVLLLLLIVRRVLRPIRMLAAGTERIRDGDYGALVRVASADELGDLAASFNVMSAALASTSVSKDFFNDILNSLQDQLVVTDAAGRITLANPSLTALLDRSREELLGQSVALLFAEGADPFHGPALERLKREGSLQNVSTYLAKKEAEKVPVLFSASVLKDKGGSLLGFIGVAKDMSEIKKLEARMRQSEKLSAVGQLAAGVAHEINNPLAVILGFAQGMAQGVKPKDPLELPVKSIEREALRCKNLVQNLLTFARTSQSDRDAMDLNDAALQTLGLIEAQAKMTQVRIQTALAPALPPILGNKNQLEQVILNLAKNAIDAMPNGGELTLSTELLDQAPQSWVCLKVADTGTGIPPAAMEKIFEPFFTTKPVGQGTGLGLSLINEIVRKHSGDIEVSSRPGRTVFTVMFPARTNQQLEDMLRAARAAKLAAPSVVPYHKR